MMYLSYRLWAVPDIRSIMVGSLLGMIRMFLLPSPCGSLTGRKMAFIDMLDFQLFVR